MAGTGFTSNLLRPTTGEESHRVTFVELFFDLVFVFAVTQLSHSILAEPTLAGFGEVLILAGAVWWAWVDTTWITNWLNPERGAVRGMLIVLMLCGLLMSSAIPEAFADKGWLFAIAFVAMQLTRTTFALFSFIEQGRRENALNVARILGWYVFSGALWIWGGFAPHDARVWIWLVALAVEFSGPISRFWLPVIGRSPVETWQVSGEHMAERVGLFFIIALGESIIVTGSVFAAQPVSGEGIAALLAAFTGTVLLWLLYFAHGERSGSTFISRASTTGTVARTTYTYIPILMVLGIVLSAVGDDLVLAHPLGHHGATDAGSAAVICGGAAVYLFGTALFKKSIGGPWLVTHLAGVLALVALFLAHDALNPLALTWSVNGVLLVVVAIDEWRFRRMADAEDESVELG
ncbi:low temperature requirement protein A [Glaciibacter flavus]|uniref:low temperature requirement protein A n=1 Tax=Orlajensenia flava TaxID=2565934 RepID=UPI003B007EFB